MSEHSVQPVGSLVGRPKEKKACTSRPCTWQATASCSKAMCKTCCVRDVTSICFNKAHNGGHRPVSTSSDAFHLVRPILSIPLCLPPFANTSGFSFPTPVVVSSFPNTSALMPPSSGETETNLFHFGKSVPLDLIADWN